MYLRTRAICNFVYMFAAESTVLLLAVGPHTRFIAYHEMLLWGSVSARFPWYTFKDVELTLHPECQSPTL
jgi:hypothetical protein